jgi:hypothetical protein
MSKLYVDVLLIYRHVANIYHLFTTWLGAKAQNISFIYYLPLGAGANIYHLFTTALGAEQVYIIFFIYINQGLTDLKFQETGKEFLTSMQKRAPILSA